MTNMENARVFEIAQIDKIDERLWKMTGLTLKTIHVGDQVCVYDDEPDDQVVSAKCTVTRIHVFGSDFPQIDRGFYIELFVSAEEGEAIIGAKWMFEK